MFDRFYKLVEALAVPRNTIGFSLFRILAGSMVLVEYLLNYAQRHFLFGPDAMFSWQAFLNQKYGFSLYQLSTEAWYFEATYHAGIVVGLLWVAGFRTAWLTPLNYLFWYSLRQRNPLLWDGGDNLMQVVFVFSFFAGVGQHFRLFGNISMARRGSLGWGALGLVTRRSSRYSESLNKLWNQVRGLSHNAALCSFFLQLSLVYMVSGLAKVQGETWQDGTALYYALWPGQFHFPGVSQLLYGNEAVLVLASYGTVFFQISFPFMVLLNGTSRNIAVILAITFHLGIAAFMGLFTFAGFMIAAELALVSNEAYTRAFATMRRALSVSPVLRSIRFLRLVN